MDIEKFRFILICFLSSLFFSLIENKFWGHHWIGISAALFFVAPFIIMFLIGVFFATHDWFIKMGFFHLSDSGLMHSVMVAYPDCKRVWKKSDGTYAVITKGGSLLKFSKGDIIAGINKSSI